MRPADNKVAAAHGGGVASNEQFGGGSPARRHPVVWFLAKRGAAAVATLLAVSVLIFVGTNLLPGNVATAILGQYATPQAVSALEERLELNRPAHERYFSWLAGIAHGDLGDSAIGQASGGEGLSIWSIIAGPVKNSAILAAISAALLIPLSIFLGVVAATRAGRLPDHFISITSLAALSIPEFVTGALLVVVFAGSLGWLPGASFVPHGSSVLSNPEILVLPVATLLAASLAQASRMIRASMIDVLTSDYVELARLMGISERRVVLHAALRNALAPTIQVIALNLQWLVGGIVITETVFAYPGIGRQLVEAVQSRDIPFVQSVGLLIAVVYVGLNIVADLLVTLVVPKLRAQV